MPNKVAKRSAFKKNESLGKAVLEEETALLGRTIKKLGNRRFRILTTDAKGHGVEVEAHVRGNIIYIQVDDVVVLGSNESAGKTTYEILGSCDKKIVKQLKDLKRLHSSLLVGADELGDDLFDRSEETDQPTGKDEEEVDVDAI